MMRDKPRKPLRCWGCGGDHLIKYCPHQSRNEGQVPNTEGPETVDQEEGTNPKICVVLEDHQEDHQSSVVEVEGEIVE